MEKKKRSQKSIAEELAPLVGGGIKSTHVFLNQILLGRRSLPKKWEGALLTVVGVKNYEELLVMFPKIKRSFCGGKDEDEDVEVAVAIEASLGKISAGKLQEFFKLIKKLNELGIKVGVTVSG